MISIHRIIAAGLMLGAGFFVAGCTNTGGASLEDAVPIATDAPALGF